LAHGYGHPNAICNLLKYYILLSASLSKAEKDVQSLKMKKKVILLIMSGSVEIVNPHNLNRRILR